MLLVLIQSVIVISVLTIQISLLFVMTWIFLRFIKQVNKETFWRIMSIVLKLMAAAFFALFLSGLALHLV